ncbi:MAG: Ctr copper transporter [Lasallia pustulata]|uniref:Copper transport protein n=1 Tax=Lasallia pustulata TaxID=136370 RepID=A0A5M8PY46_9LECA|nr:MAG: Ctr copper transporter [Lasallia pustulata]
MSSMTSPPSAAASTPMPGMNSVFYTSTSTPLYSPTWVPTSTGAYAGTCVFLVALATIFRVLLAGKHLLEHRWLDRELNRRYVIVHGKPGVVEAAKAEEASNATLVTARGVEESVRVVRKRTRGVAPWRLSVDAPRAAYATVMVGVAYLLMLAVMTMNVGYFLSVLAGTFVGELAVGRYTELAEH